MERVGKRRRGPPPLHDMAIHVDGAINQVIMTSVYVLYVDKCSGEVTQGGSREHGGGLNYGSSADGQMRRGAEGLLCIPNNSTYVFPGYFVQHSVRPVASRNVVRWSFVVFWNTKTYWGTGTSRATTNHHLRRQWALQGTTGSFVCPRCAKACKTKATLRRHKCNMAM